MDQLNGVECYDYIPNIGEYLKAFDAVEYLFLSFGGVAMIGTLIASGVSLYHTFRFVSDEYRQYNVKILIVYPIVAICSFTRILVPRANLFLHSVAFVAYCFGSYSMIKLCTAYIGSDTQFVENARLDSYRVRTLPLCCFFFCLRDTRPTMKKIRITKLMVLQLSIVVPIQLLVQNVMFIENEQMYNDTIFYFVPLYCLSILCSIWGLNIYTGMVAGYVPEWYKVSQKYTVLQLVLLALKFQVVIGYLIIAGGFFDCYPPLTPSISKNIFVNFIICMEMFGLSMWARHLYLKPVHNSSSHTFTA